MVVFIVLCLGDCVQTLLCCWRLMYVIIFLVKLKYFSGHLLGLKLLIRFSICFHGIGT